MSRPLVSVCIPTYNGEEFLSEALASLENQTYQNIEVIISDDNSTDGTIGIVENFQERSEFPVIIFHHKPKGIGANWNNCIRNANGEFIKFLFQDDILYPSCLEEMLRVFELFPDVRLVAAKRDFIMDAQPDDNIKIWIEKYVDLQVQLEPVDDVYLLDNKLFGRDYFYRSPLNKIGEPTAVMFKTEVIEEIGYFDHGLEQILDYVFYYRLLKKYPIAILNKSLVGFRIHDKQATNVNRHRSIDDYDHYQRILYDEFLPLLNDKVQSQLRNRFSKKRRLINRIKRELRRFR